jgi:hypothetical protein
MLQGLRDPIMMAKKKDFEKNFRASIEKDKNLNSRYGDLWGNIQNTRKQLTQVSNENYALAGSPQTTSEYFAIADDIITLAREYKQPEDQRSEEYQGKEFASLVDDVYPDNIDRNQEKEKISRRIEKLYNYMGSDYPVLSKVTGGGTPSEAADKMISSSALTSREKTAELMRKGPDAVLNSDDPFIVFILESEKRRKNFSRKPIKLLRLNQLIPRD